ncbi:hypothetical protein Emag_003497 [Eimeria magna]
MQLDQQPGGSLSVSAQVIGSLFEDSPSWAVYSCPRPSERVKEGAPSKASIPEGAPPLSVPGLGLKAEGPPVSAGEGEGGEKALLRRVWKQQGRLSPAQAADAAFFLLLRTFQLSPGLAERSALMGLCSSLQKRMHRMQLPELQLLLADLAAIYSPLFLPLFIEAAKEIEKQDQAAHRDTGDSYWMAEKDSLGGKDAAAAAAAAAAAPAATAAAAATGLTPLHAAFLLHAYGRTDCRDTQFFALCLSRVTAAARELLHAQRAIITSRGAPSSAWGPPGGPPRAPQHQAAFELPFGEPRGDERSQLHGESLVMCLRGLANIQIQISREDRALFLELLMPYLLEKQPSVLGSPPPSRRLALLFGALSAITRLGAGPHEVCELMEAACKQPPETLGPYEACDLLAAALALQPSAAAAAAAAAGESATAAFAVSLPEASSTAAAAAASAAATASASLSGAAAEGKVELEAPGRREALTLGLDAALGLSAPTLLAAGVGVGFDALSLIDERKISSSSSSFKDVIHGYACSVRLGLEALRLSLFRMHPAFRVSVLATLASLDVVLPPSARPPRRLLVSLPASPGHIQQQQQETHAARILGDSTIPNVHAAAAGAGAGAAAAAAAAEGCGAQARGRGPQQGKEDVCLAVSSTTSLSSCSIGSGALSSCMQSPLHPLVRRVLLAVFYRLPCVSLRLLVELLEALHACDYTRREEVGEKLSPHGKSDRWHR